MNVEQTAGPSTRTEFERNIFLSIEMARNGRLHFSEKSQRTVEGLMAMRSLPNKRIDLRTVNEGARSVINMIGNMQHDIHQEKLNTQEDKTDGEELC
jgi:hypothetical protein